MIYTEDLFTPIKSWDDFMKLIGVFAGCDNVWVFRGQPAGEPLRTSFERECEKNSIQKCAAELEEDLINEFRRQYAGVDQERVTKDTLYCLSLMRHYGAPTRLLDWTYSPYVAFFNALESWERKSDVSKPEYGKQQESCTLWCLNSIWCGKRARAIAGNYLIDKRNDELRDDESFHELYMSGKYKNFVFLENPFFFNERLKIQQGVFLCPGDVCRPICDVIGEFAEDEYDDKIIQISCELDRKERWVALKELHRMNINRASLYPGIGGMATSLIHRLLWKYEPSKQCPSAPG